MKRPQLIKLIEADIINMKLVSSLNDIGIDLSIYSLNIESLILKNMGIKKHLRTEELYKRYFELLKQGKKIHPTNKADIRKLALKIYRFLLNQI
ncbi:MAG: hypothetical protein ACO1N0_15345 [Fluviicola sp.]